MNELELIEKKEMRDEFINRIEILDKVKQLLLLPDVNLATTQQVADFYEVDKKLIEWHIKENRNEIESDGYTVWKAENFKSEKLKVNKNRGNFEVEFSNGEKEKFAPRGVALFTQHAILKIGFLLCDSKIACKLRSVVSREYPRLYEQLISNHRLRFKKQEQKYYDYLKFSFGKENIKSQVKCGNCFIDFILYDKIAIEVDENGHKSYDKDSEVLREKYIKNQ